MSPYNPRHDDSVSVLRMVIGVAIVVALIVLLFFAIGYGLGRAFL